MYVVADICYCGSKSFSSIIFTTSPLAKSWIRAWVGPRLTRKFFSGKSSQNTTKPVCTYFGIVNHVYTMLPITFNSIIHRQRSVLCFFSPFAAVSLFGVAGLAETFPFFSVSGPFLLDFPGFQVPSDSIFPSQLWSSSRVLPLHLHFCNCSDVFSVTSPFDVSKPFQPSPSHNRRYRFHLCFFQDLLISPVF